MLVRDPVLRRQAHLEGGASFPGFGQQSLCSPFLFSSLDCFLQTGRPAPRESCRGQWNLSSKRAGAHRAFCPPPSLKCLEHCLAHWSFSINICRKNWWKDFSLILVKILKEGDLLQDFQRGRNRSLYRGKEGSWSAYQQAGHAWLSISEVIHKGSMARELRTSLSEPHCPAVNVRMRVGSWETEP